jgi:hypothetical protein
MADELLDLRSASREEILDAIDDAFHGTPELDDTEIEVFCEKGTNPEMGPSIKLVGTVGSENERQIAEQIITDVLGLPDCQNMLQVNEASREGAPGYDKQQTDDTDYMGEALELLDEGVIDDEIGYTPPDHPIPETTVENFAPKGKEGRH